MVCSSHKKILCTYLVLTKCLIGFRFVSETQYIWDVGFILFTLYLNLEFFSYVDHSPQYTLSSVMDESTFAFIFLLAVTKVFTKCWQWVIIQRKLIRDQQPYYLFQHFPVCFEKGKNSAKMVQLIILLSSSYKYISNFIFMPCSKRPESTTSALVHTLISVFAHYSIRSNKHEDPSPLSQMLLDFYCT